MTQETPTPAGRRARRAETSGQMAGSLDQHQGNPVANLGAYRRRRRADQPMVTIADVASLPLRRAMLADRFPNWQPWEVEIAALREIAVYLDFCTLPMPGSPAAMGRRR